MDAAVGAKPGRSLVGFYVALGVVAALVGLGAWLYKPLHLRYAIYRLEHSVARDVPPDWQALKECSAASLKGNRPALKTIIDACGVRRFGMSIQLERGAPDGGIYDNPAYAAFQAQPGPFLEVLSDCPDDQTKRTIETIMLIALSQDGFRSAHRDELTGQKHCGFPSALELIRGMESHLAKVRRPEVRQALAVAIDFTSRRFARELTQAEDAEGLERRIAAAPYGGRSGDVSGSISLITERIVLAGKLAEAGPVAYPNLRRLLTSPDRNLRAEVLSALHHPKYAWLLPLIVESARDGNAEAIEEAYAAARSIVGGSPNPMQPAAPLDEKTSRQQRVEELRKALLAWWQREGQAKFGEPKK